MGFIQEAAIFSSTVKLILVITIAALYFAGAFHIIDTGYIGVYKRGGALLNTWTEPGLHFMIPFITKVEINFKLVSLSSSNTANRSS
jgi:regulator of protease activity HflC (stomatin/prohibitin superfamily)